MSRSAAIAAPSPWLLCLMCLLVAGCFGEVSPAGSDWRGPSADAGDTGSASQSDAGDPGVGPGLLPSDIPNEPGIYSIEPYPGGRPTTVEIIRPITLAPEVRHPETDPAFARAEVADDAIRYHYDASPSLELMAGDIVVGEEGGGYLRRVLEVTVLDSQTVELQTFQADFTEVLADGHFIVESGPPAPPPNTPINATTIETGDFSLDLINLLTPGRDMRIVMKPKPLGGVIPDGCNGTLPDQDPSLNFDPEDGTRPVCPEPADCGQMNCFSPHACTACDENCPGVCNADGDSDIDLNWLDCDAQLTGEVAIEPVLDIHITWRLEVNVDWFRLERFGFGVTGELDAGLKFAFEAAAKLGCEIDFIRLIENKFLGREFTTKFKTRLVVGGLPILLVHELKPVLSLNVGLTLKVQAEYDWLAQAQFNGGFLHQEGLPLERWGNLTPVDNDAVRASVAGSGSAGFELGVSYWLAFYAFAGPKLSLTGTVGGSISEAQNTCSWEARVGFDGKFEITGVMEVPWRDEPLFDVGSDYLTFAFPDPTNECPPDPDYMCGTLQRYRGCIDDNAWFDCEPNGCSPDPLDAGWTCPEHCPNQCDPECADPPMGFACTPEQCPHGCGEDQANCAYDPDQNIITPPPDGAVCAQPVFGGTPGDGGVDVSEASVIDTTWLEGTVEDSNSGAFKVGMRYAREVAITFPVQMDPTQEVVARIWITRPLVDSTARVLLTGGRGPEELPGNFDWRWGAGGRTLHLTHWERSWPSGFTAQGIPCEPFSGGPEVPCSDLALQQFEIEVLGPAPDDGLWSHTGHNLGPYRSRPFAIDDGGVCERVSCAPDFWWCEAACRCVLAVGCPAGAFPFMGQECCARAGIFPGSLQVACLEWYDYQCHFTENCTDGDAWTICNRPLTDCEPRSCREDACWDPVTDTGPSDGCGGMLDCGGCPGGETCGGSGIPYICGRPQACRAVELAEGGRACGSLYDNDSGFVDCGACPVGQACGIAGVPNICSPGLPDPRCVDANAECGWARIDGDALYCGDCDYPQFCGAAGIENVCGQRPIECSSVECGPVDGAECGECPADGACVDGRCTQPCEEAGVECGETVIDGTPVDCGGCPYGPCQIDGTCPCSGVECGDVLADVLGPEGLITIPVTCSCCAEGTCSPEHMCE